MYRVIAILAVFAVVSAAGFAASPLSTNSSPQSEPMAGWDDAAQAFRALAVDASGYLQTTMTPSTATPTYYTPTTDARGRVSAPSQYAGNLSTSTPSLLSALASWTPPCALQIQVNGVSFYSIATTTAATVWAGQRMAANDTLWITPSTAAYSISFIASSSAIASYSILVHPLVP
jgi:hypothetical protein